MLDSNSFLDHSAYDAHVYMTAAHSMEEAEALCDRLGIFVNGELQCIGNAKEVGTKLSHGNCFPHILHLKGSCNFMDNHQLFHSITILVTLGITNVLARLTYLPLLDVVFTRWKYYHITLL
jgi:hypothetical protein